MTILETNTIFSKGDYIFGTNSILLLPFANLTGHVMMHSKWRAIGILFLIFVIYITFCQCFEILFLIGPEKLI